MLRELHGKKRLRFSDDQRKRLATKGGALGRRVLRAFRLIVTPDTILRWHRELIARKMDAVVSDELAINRASARMLTAFGALALVLAAIGIYGVMAALVAARGREIGIRIALGASKAHIVGVVLAPGMTMAALGIGAGVAGALASARLLESLLYGVSATDVRTIVVVAGVLLAATLVATYLPTRRALAVDPATALQGE